MPELLPVDLPEAHLQERDDLLLHVIDEAVRAEVDHRLARGGPVYDLLDSAGLQRSPLGSIFDHDGIAGGRQARKRPVVLIPDEPPLAA
jgi:hypothetical protein